MGDVIAGASRDVVITGAAFEAVTASRTTVKNVVAKAAVGLDALRRSAAIEVVIARAANQRDRVVRDVGAREIADRDVVGTVVTLDHQSLDTCHCDDLGADRHHDIVRTILADTDRIVAVGAEDRNGVIVRATVDGVVAIAHDPDHRIGACTATDAVDAGVADQPVGTVAASDDVST